MKKYDTYIIITPKDLDRVKSQYRRLMDNLESERLVFVGSDKVGKIVEEMDLGDKAGFINENDILDFNTVWAVFNEHMSELLQGDEMPRGGVGWYYQQFIKYRLAFITGNDYYMTWDGDTIPCRPVHMFSGETDQPYMDNKGEYHKLYFDTMAKLIPGAHKVIRTSFISEHMIFNVDMVKKLVAKIEQNDAIPGEKFWEKVIHAIDPLDIKDAAFSEFETYGTFVALTNPSLYRLREWHSFRLGAEFFSLDTICDRDYDWLGKDFDAISFEKNQSVRPDNANLFDNPIYQQKLTAKQMLQIAQEEFKGGYVEDWGGDAPLRDPNETSNDRNNAAGENAYEKMGDAIIGTNPDQAYLCYEKAVFESREESAKEKLCEKLEKCAADNNVKVRKLGIVILTYNNKRMTQECIRSIRETCPEDSYKVVVVDNASTDGTADWLRAARGTDIVSVINGENKGFPAGCNQGAAELSGEYDLLFLNNDTIVMPNALFWLRMALYENDTVGAVGCMANYAGNDQVYNVKYDTVDEYRAFAATVNLPSENPYEERTRLCGFAMMVKRNVLDEVGGFDEAFTPGYFEDDDLSLRIRKAGYRLLIVHNSFIFHYGSASFNDPEAGMKIMEKNYMYFMQKWGFDEMTASTVTPAEKQLLYKIKHGQNDPFTLLYVGARSGNALTRIKYIFRNCSVTGLEKEASAASNALAESNVKCMDWHEGLMDIPEKNFDYIFVIADDNDSEGQICDAFTAYLKDSGILEITKR